MDDLDRAVRRKLRISKDAPLTWEIRKRSVDARKKPEVRYNYTIAASVPQEAAILRRLGKDRDICADDVHTYRLPDPGRQQLSGRVVIVGSGPAGLFCTLTLARAGYRPVLLERGDAVAQRTAKVARFWDEGILDPESNVQFGEGGAGTFSDGKLNTMIKDPEGLIREVYKTFVRHGADDDILWSYKPHIGTDVLARVIPSIRGEITNLGGQVLFRHRLVDLDPGKEDLLHITVDTPDGIQKIDAGVLVAAIGHSARDTFEMLFSRGIAMEAKAFAAGVRVQHPQHMIDEAMYGADCPYELDSASYKLTQNINGRGIYSFCMCPGGYVINASSEPGHLAVNGMSMRSRDSGMANSAIVVTISPEEYGAKHPLDGIIFQRELEKRAFEAGKGAIPLQTLADFRLSREKRDEPAAEEQRPGEAPGETEKQCAQTAWQPQIKGAWRRADVRSIFPEAMASLIEEGMTEFGRKIRGFDDDNVLLCAAESRTSSPVRILRGDDGTSISHPLLYPCGEGAGYAGGITSAAVDGIRTAAAVIRRYAVPAADSFDL